MCQSTRRNKTVGRVLRSWCMSVSASTMTRVEAVASLLPRIATGTPTGVEGVTRVTEEAKTFMHRDRGVWPATLLRLVD